MSEGTEVGTLREGVPPEKAPDEGMELVRAAVEGGHPIEVVERIVALQEHLLARKARQEFFDALAAFQKEMPLLRKTADARITTKGGATYGYTYAPLPEIVTVVRPVLQRHGFSFAWTTEGVENRALNVVCVLRHIGGHEERSAFPVGIDTAAAMSEAQKHGAALTYGQRQSLVSVLGLAASDDTDGADPPAPGGLIDAEQLANVEALIQEVKADRGGFLALFGIERLEDMPLANVDVAIRALESRRNRQREG